MHVQAYCDRIFLLCIQLLSHSSSLSLKSGSMCIANLYPIVLQVKINHPLLSTIRAVIGTLTCTNMASNSTSDSKAVRKSTVIALIVRGLECVIN